MLVSSIFFFYDAGMVLYPFYHDLFQTIPCFVI